MSCMLTFSYADADYQAILIPVHGEQGEPETAVELVRFTADGCCRSWHRFAATMLAVVATLTEHVDSYILT